MNIDLLDPKSFFHTTHKKIQSLFNEHVEYITDYHVFSSGGKLETIPQSVQKLHELLDTDNYVLNILGEPYYMLHHLATIGVVPVGAELYGLASFLTISNKYSSKEHAKGLISRQHFLYNHLKKWSYPNLTVVTNKLLSEKFSYLFDSKRLVYSTRDESKSIFENLLSISDGIKEVYKLLIDPNYIFITSDYMHIYDEVISNLRYSSDINALGSFCITSPRKITYAKQVKAVYDFEAGLTFLDKVEEQHQKYGTYSDIFEPYSEIGSKYTLKQIFSNALLKNRFKNAIFFADLYATFSTTSLRAINDVKYEEHRQREDWIKSAVRDWEDMSSEYGIHEDEL